MNVAVVSVNWELVSDVSMGVVSALCHPKYVASVMYLVVGLLRDKRTGFFQVSSYKA